MGFLIGGAAAHFAGMCHSPDPLTIYSSESQSSDICATAVLHQCSDVHCLFVSDESLHPSLVYAPLSSETFRSSLLGNSCPSDNFRYLGSPRVYIYVHAGVLLLGQST